MPITSYQSILETFVSQNDQVVLRIFITSHVDKTEGNVFCVCPNKLLLPQGAILLEEQLTNLYILPCLQNPSDFELPMHLICLLRSYPWQFYNEIDETLINLFRLTFQGKEAVLTMF